MEADDAPRCWTALPPDLQALILQRVAHIDVPDFFYLVTLRSKVDASWTPLKEPSSRKFGLALHARTLNKAFASDRFLKTHIVFARAGDPDAFVRLVLAYIALPEHRRGPSCKNPGAVSPLNTLLLDTASYSMFHAHVIRLCGGATQSGRQEPIRGLYDSLFKYYPFAVRKVPTEFRPKYASILANIFKYVNSYYCKRHDLTSLKAEFGFLNVRADADERREARPWLTPHHFLPELVTI
tara:strand:+ start:3196 stop:3912 length:717 start_codon:yes stop_codon:yes gene_type:complete